MVAHEYAHAEAAYRQGDDTAHMLGRLTMNPLKHIDPFMTVLLPIMLWVASGGRYAFGAAKPVPVNPRNYRNYVRGDIIVSLAGITVNLALFVVFTGVFALVGMVGQSFSSGAETFQILQRMAKWGMVFNLVLAFFNLVPIPPLDGSHVFYHLLPPAAGLRYRQIARFGFLPILALTFVPGFISVVFWPVMQLMHLSAGLVGRFELPGVTP
jgi:Zn-dependent protease